jgi:hypothetical protein
MERELQIYGTSLLENRNKDKMTNVHHPSQAKPVSLALT